MEAVKDRSSVHAVALVDERDRIVAGTGAPHDLTGLARIARKVVRGECNLDHEEVTRGTDVLARGVHAGGRTLYFAALGERVTRLPEAAQAVERILAS